MNAINCKDALRKSMQRNKKQNISEDATYTVQIATYSSKVILSKFKGLKDVYYIDSKNKTYLYMSGEFNDSNAAVEHKNKLVKMLIKAVNHKLSDISNITSEATQDTIPSPENLITLNFFKLFTENI